MKLVSTLAAMGLLIGCATSRQITDLHPYAKALLSSCVTDVPLFLYRSDARQPFYPHRYKLVSYKYTEFKRIENVYEPEAILPAGTTVRGERLSLEHSMSIAAGITIYGTAVLPSGERVQLVSVIENVGGNLIEWQKKHGLMSLPSTEDYVARASVSSAPWCASGKRGEL